jgi:hypothetical protein
MFATERTINRPGRNLNRDGLAFRNLGKIDAAAAPQGREGATVLRVVGSATIQGQDHSDCPRRQSTGLSDVRVRLLPRRLRRGTCAPLKPALGSVAAGHPTHTAGARAPLASNTACANRARMINSRGRDYSCRTVFQSRTCSGMTARQQYARLRALAHGLIAEQHAKKSLAERGFLDELILPGGY